MMEWGGGGGGELAILGLKKKGGGGQNLQDSGEPFGLRGPGVKFSKGVLDFEERKVLLWHYIVPYFKGAGGVFIKISSESTF